MDARRGWWAAVLALASGGQAAAALDYHELGQMADTCVVADAARSRAWTVEMRAAPVKSKPQGGLSPNSWAMVLGCRDGKTLTARMQTRTDDFGTEHERRVTLVSVSVGDSAVFAEQYTRGFTPDGYNTLVARYDPRARRVTLAGGGEMEDLGVYDVDEALAGAIAYGRAQVATLVVDTDAAPGFSPERVDLGRTGKRTWEYLDRDTDAAYARLGGHYRIATVPDGAGGYDIAYLSGAEVCAPLWEEGMKKGAMKPSRAGGYDLRWLDAEGRGMGPEANAQINGGILTLNFPLYRSTLRFVEVGE